MNCKKCKRIVTHTINDMCVPCYIKDNLPTKVKDTPWVIAESYERTKSAQEKINRDFDKNLALAIVNRNFEIEKSNNTISIQIKNKVLSIPITIERIDNLAHKSGILVGKWLIHKMETEIDSAWKVIAENTWSEKLGISAKVSTLLHKSKRYVICVYTYNYLDLGVYF